MGLFSLSAMLVQFNGINLSRNQQVILQDIRWEMQEGEHWVILGANGSGKTSLINTILGFEPPSSGRFMVLNQPYGTCPWDTIRQQIGVVSSAVSRRIQPAETSLHAVLSGKRATINYWGDPTEKELAEAGRWLYLVGCEHIAKRPWAVISQGERQRVLIARALIGRPKLLILDEPWAGLDPVARESFLGFLQDTLTVEFRIPCILVTHHVEEILPMFSHVMLLRAGKVLAAGPRKQVMTDPLMSAVFGAPVSLEQDSGRVHMRILRNNT